MARRQVEPVEKCSISDILASTPYYQTIEENLLSFAEQHLKSSFFEISKPTRKISSGAYASVYLGKDTRSDELVAIKMTTLDDKQYMVEHMSDEIAINLLLQHQNIVVCHLAKVRAILFSICAYLFFLLTLYIFSLVMKTKRREAPYLFLNT